MSGTDWESGPLARDLHVCAVCGERRPCYTEVLAADPYTGAPAGWYCEDDTERLLEVEQLNAEQYGLSGSDRAMVAEALRYAAATGRPNLTTAHARNLADLADRLSRPAVRL